MYVACCLAPPFGISGGKQILQNTIKFDVRIIMEHNKYSFLAAKAAL